MRQGLYRQLVVTAAGSSDAAAAQRAVDVYPGLAARYVAVWLDRAAGLSRPGFGALREAMDTAAQAGPQTGAADVDAAWGYEDPGLLRWVDQVLTADAE